MADTTEPRSKRKRTASPTAGATTEPTRSAIWLDDGNIVLQAERVQFRVHRSVLARSSGVFRDMFAVVQPGSQTEDLVDGVPVVHLSDFHVDVEWVLQALYGDRRHANKQEDVPFEMVAAFIRLGAKYGFEELYREGVRLVLEYLPSTLVDWDDGASPIADPNGDLGFTLSNLCVEAGLQIALPAALYWCSIHTLQDLMTGFKYGDDDTRCVTRLSAQNVERAVIGKGILEEQNRLCLFGYMGGEAAERTSEKCISDSSCRHARKTCFYNLFSNGVPDAFDHWNGDRFTSGFCEECSKAAEEYWKEERQKMWDDLPSVFNLPSWEELRKDPYPEIKNDG